MKRVTGCSDRLRCATMRSEVARMANALTLAQIESRYPSEWVLVEDPETDAALEVRAGNDRQWHRVRRSAASEPHRSSWPSANAVSDPLPHSAAERRDRWTARAGLPPGATAHHRLPPRSPDAYLITAGHLRPPRRRRT